MRGYAERRSIQTYARPELVLQVESGRIQFFYKRLDDARLQQDEFLAKRVEAGDQAAKQARIEAEELQPGPISGSEARVQDAADETMAGDDSEGGLLQSVPTPECPVQ